MEENLPPTYVVSNDVFKHTADVMGKLEAVLAKVLTSALIHPLL
jgi:hypothetical protein